MTSAESRLEAKLEELVKAVHALDKSFCSHVAREEYLVQDFSWRVFKRIVGWTSGAVALGTAIGTGMAQLRGVLW